jgi:hypothetical protein
MKLTGVTVSLAPDAVNPWEDGTHATSKAIVDDQVATATATPESKASIRNIGCCGWRLDAPINRFALAIGAWPMLETARTGGDARFPAGV